MVKEDIARLTYSIMTLTFDYDEDDENLSHHHCYIIYDLCEHLSTISLSLNDRVYKKEVSGILSHISNRHEDPDMLLCDPKYIWEKAKRENLYNLMLDFAKQDIQPSKYIIEAVEDIDHKNKTQEKETKMSQTRVIETAKTVVSKKKTSLETAAKIKAGQLAIKSLQSAGKKHLPYFAKGYVDHEFAPVVASAFITAVAAQFPENKKLEYISDAVSVAADLNAIEALNIDALIDDLFGDIDVPNKE